MDMTQVLRSDPEWPIQVIPGKEALNVLATHGWQVRQVGRTEGGMPLYEVAGFDVPTEVFEPVPESADPDAERRVDLMKQLSEALAPDTVGLIHEVSYTGLRAIASWSYVLRNGGVSYIDHHGGVRDSMRRAEEDMRHANLPPESVRLRRG